MDILYKQDKVHLIVDAHFDGKPLGTNVETVNSLAPSIDD